MKKRRKKKPGKLFADDWASSLGLRGRKRRCALAPEWVAEYRGHPKNMLRRYRKAFDIPLEWALEELLALGAPLNENYVAAVRQTLQDKPQRGPKANPITEPEFAEYQERLHWGDDSDENFAYIAGYTSGGFPFGITWEEWDELEDGDFDPFNEPDPANGGADPESC